MKWTTTKAIILFSIVGFFLVCFMFFSLNDEPITFERHEDMTEIESSWDLNKLATVFYSPGELHSVHNQVIIQCQHCHKPLNQVSNERCSGCHTENDFIENTKNIVLKDAHLEITANLQSCFDCHTEHQGFGGSISGVFNYDGHRTLIEENYREECSRCHLSEAKTKHVNMINETCSDCHKLEEPFQWSATTFNHLKVEKLKIDINIRNFTRLPFPDKGQCSDCHESGFHIEKEKKVDGVITNVEGNFDCTICHGF
ncbi:MAG: cytochrome c3 family protein [Anaerobacillus sp.]|uniref:cytochrome c3 family protein n=1 Tax=Anaerobacillus sp. TaxID=1872506 RepID=UPI0039198186